MGNPKFILSQISNFSKLGCPVCRHLHTTHQPFVLLVARSCYFPNLGVPRFNQVATHGRLHMSHTLVHNLNTSPIPSFRSAQRALPRLPICMILRFVVHGTPSPGRLSTHPPTQPDSFTWTTSLESPHNFTWVATQLHPVWPNDLTLVATRLHRAHPNDFTRVAWWPHQACLSDLT